MALAMQAADSGLHARIFFCYPLISRQALEFYSCEDIKGTSYLRKDFGIRCFTGAWMSYLLVNCVFTVLYPVGIPFFFFLCARGNKGQPDNVDIAYGFLYQAFTDDHWWFEVVEMANRLILTSMLQFFSPTSRYAAGMLVAMLYIFANLLWEPYIHARDGSLAVFSEVMVLLMLLSAHVTSVEGKVVDGSSQELLVSLTLIVSTVVVFVMCLVNVARIIALQRKKVKRKKMRVQLNSAQFQN